MLCAKQIAAIVIISGITIFTYFILPSIQEVRSENARFKDRKITHISFQFNARDGSTGIPLGTIYIDLKVDFPRGILIAGDVIKISGVIDGSRLPRDLITFGAYFSGSQAYPEKQDNKGITELASINFHGTQERNIMVANETEMMWTFEGEYHLNIPLLRPGQEPEIVELARPVITVYPRSVWIQVLTNEAITNITIVALLLGIVGVGDIAYRLWTSVS